MDPRELVEKFCEQCVWTSHIVNQYRLLFEFSEARLTLLDEVAPDFFRSLQRVLIDYIFLQCTRITDPSSIGKSDNLTAEYLVKNIKWPSDEKLRLERLLETLHQFRVQIVEARNKLITHADLVSHERGSALGTFPEGDEQKFFDALQEFADIAHSNIVGGPYAIDTITPGDASDLVRVLKRGVVFGMLLEEDPLLYDSALRKSRLFNA